MLRHITVPVIMLLLANSLFASRPDHPLAVKLNVKEPSGYNSAIEFDVLLDINQDLVTPDFKESEIEVKVFLPEALRLRSGQKNWNGKLELNLKEKFSFNVRPALRQNLIYDIAVVVDSKDWYEPLIITRSIYMEETRGVVLENDVIAQLIKTPWLRKALGASETNIADKSGKRIRAMTISSDKLQPPVDDDEKLKEERPNRLYSDEYMQYLRRTDTGKVKEDDFLKQRLQELQSASGTRLASTAYCLGAIRNSVEYICDVKVVAFTLDGQNTVTLGEDYTWHVYPDIGYYEFTFDEDDIIDDYIGIIAYLINSHGDPVQDTLTITYSLKDTTYTYLGGGPTYYFGTSSFNDQPASYNGAAQLHQFLYETRTKTYNEAGYNAPYTNVEYPQSGYLSGDGNYGLNNIKIHADKWNSHFTLGHEFGHHVDRHITGSWGGCDRSCSLCGTEAEALGEDAWGDFYGIWAADMFSSTYDGWGQVVPFDCGANVGPRVPIRVFGALYDFIDDRDDGEECELSMSDILQYGLADSAETIYEIYNNLITQFPGDSAAINDVKELNEISNGGWLLASVPEKVQYPAASTIAGKLLQNSPNPFNPSTTISYEVGGDSPAEVSLKIYDIRGREITELVSGSREPGRHAVFWNGENFSGTKVSSGVYIYRLRINEYTQTRKMVLMK